MTIRAHSFDVFDTCLVRTFARPVDVLAAAADRVAPDGPGRPERLSELVRHRQAAERRAMERLGAEAVTLDVIFEELPEELLLGVARADFRAAELAVECESVRPVRAALERVRAAREAGLRVLFISDMYLPAAEIRVMLERFALARPEDGLYVSGDLGISKRSGQLFDHILEAEGLAPAELVHAGDDPVTDDAAPTAKGIAVAPVRIAKLSRFEQAMLSGSLAPRPFVSRVAGLARAERVGRSPESGWLADAAAVAADVVAPLFCAYVAWVLREAREQGLERLYFVSRDSQVLLRAARELRRDGDPECRYLYGSRQAWLLAGVDRVDRDALDWLLNPKGVVRTPRSLLAKLEIDASEVAGELTRRGLEPDQRLGPPQLESFWAFTDDVERLVMDRAGAARDRLVRYLDQERLTAPGAWGLVDIGWQLNAQRALFDVLRQEGLGSRGVGLYFGLNDRRLPLAETGPAQAFVLEDDEALRGHLPDDWLFGNLVSVEQVFALADHGSCAGYAQRDGRMEPVLRALEPDETRDAYLPVLHETVAGYATAAAEAALFDGDGIDEVRRIGLQVGRMAFEHPTPAEARAIGRLRVADDQNETRFRQIAEPLRASNFAWRAGRKLRRSTTRDFDRDPIWSEGSLAITSPTLRLAFHGSRLAFALARERGRALRRHPAVLRARARAGR